MEAHNARRQQNGRNGREGDEILDYLDARYVGPCEAAWRLSQFEMHARKPAICRLQIHLEDQQMVIFREGGEAGVLQNANIRKTTLTEYFTANANARNRAANGEELEFDCRQLLYQDFPSRMTWDHRNRKWKVRRGRFSTIGRMVYVSPAAGERFFMRLLLTAVRGATSFRDLRRINGVEHPNYKNACVALGLLDTDEEWDECLREAATWQGGHQLRSLFVLLLLHCNPADPLALWNNHREHLSDDCAHQLRENYGIEQPTGDQVNSLALCLIRDILRANNSTLEAHRLPLPQHEFQPAAAGEHRLIQDELNYNADALRQIVLRDVPRLNDEQRHAYDTLCAAVENGEGGVFFLDGFGGTGKTFVINLTLAKVRSERKIAVAVASSGIAATLLDGGTTAHSRFKIPITIIERSTCNIAAQSPEAALIQRMELLFWDEAVMQHRHVFEAVDRTFRDILQDERPFGGIVVCLCGDFRQTLPIIPKGTRGQIVSACVKRSALWRHFQMLRLTINMRLRCPGLTPEQEQQQRAFGERVLAVGDGQGGNDTAINWPIDSIVPDNSIESLTNTIFPGLSDRNSPPPTSAFLADRVLLAAQNDTVKAINHTLLDSMPGQQVRNYRSADRIIEDGGIDIYPPEYLNTIEVANLPHHEFKVKVNAPAICLRNLSPHNGLCNGTRLRVVQLGDAVIEGEILSGKHAGGMVFIPRMPLNPTSSAELPFEFLRVQFPLRLAFAMTINKSQGQTLNHVGVILTNPVFAHGQLYVALSRVTNQDNLHLVVPDSEEALRDGQILNVVYTEVFRERQFTC